ncbi:MAG: sigma-70 family RNA polymerase sigma factor, partial [Actinomycetota bacterium]|nr:sigma-70 family RNA polymerase sigma factor [Actinomycetota bacterium]
MTPEIETLIRSEYEGFKPEIIRTVSSKLAGDGVRPLESDLDYSYNEAWHALYMKLAAGEEVENRKGFLVTVTHRRALNEFRAWHPSRRASTAEVENQAGTVDLEDRIDAADQLRQFREGLRSRLSAREQEAATLCYLHGLSRPEAARVMGVSPRRMEKIMDGASSRVQELIGEIRAGEFCDGMSSTIRAYAVGLLDPDGDRYEIASRHLEHCPACRRQVLVLRGFGAILPPVPAVFLLLGGTSGGGVIAAGTQAVNPGAGT